MVSKLRKILLGAMALGAVCFLGDNIKSNIAHAKQGEGNGQFTLACDPNKESDIRGYIFFYNDRAGSGLVPAIPAGQDASNREALHVDHCNSEECTVVFDGFNKSKTYDWQAIAVDTSGTTSLRFDENLKKMVGYSNKVSGVASSIKLDSTNPSIVDVKYPKIAGLQDMIRINVSDRYGINSVNVNNIPAERNNIYWQLPFSELGLPEGDQSAEINVQDKSGNTNQKNIDFCFDLSPPEFYTEVPAYANAQSTLTGEVSDECGVSFVAINGKQITLDEDSFNIPLSSLNPVQGKNTLEIAVGDFRGHFSEGIIEFNYDGIAPTGELKIQEDGRSLFADITYSGGPATLDFDIGYYNTSIDLPNESGEILINVPLSEIISGGSKKFNATLEDRVGNEFSTSSLVDIESHATEIDSFEDQFADAYWDARGDDTESPEIETQDVFEGEQALSFPVNPKHKSKWKKDLYENPSLREKTFFDADYNGYRPLEMKIKYDLETSKKDSNHKQHLEPGWNSVIFRNKGFKEEGKHQIDEVEVSLHPKKRHKGHKRHTDEPESSVTLDRWFQYTTKPLINSEDFEEVENPFEENSHWDKPHKKRGIRCYEAPLHEDEADITDTHYFELGVKKPHKDSKIKVYLRDEGGAIAHKELDRDRKQKYIPITKQEFEGEIDQTNVEIFGYCSKGSGKNKIKSFAGDQLFYMKNLD